jgi:hypothetical protein
MERGCSTNGEKMNAYRILVGKPARKRQLGRSKRRWVGNNYIYLRENGMVWPGMMSLWIDTSGGLL